tara:strand:- start:3197 stop:4366 length:1170 start_codon:yes stop_codon:yes gene_type:complete
MTTLWATIIILGVLITIHEFGHFIAARSVGVRVERFSIGIPPRFITLKSIDDAIEFNLFFFSWSSEGLRWKSIYKKIIRRPGRIASNTEYVLALLPLGGYVKMAGFIDENMDADIRYEKYEFLSQPLWAKIWVLSAGVIMNTILAFFLFASIGYYQGLSEISDKPFISDIVDGHPASVAGINPGDKIVNINGQDIQTWKELSEIINSNPDTKLDFTIDRKGTLETLSITTTSNIRPGTNGMDTLGVIGIYPEVVYKDLTIKEALAIGFSRTLGSFQMIFDSLKLLAYGSASVKDFGGPIMIAQLAGQTAEAGMVPFFTFMALLSVNLAFLNILPIPGLDGGHIFIHLLEGIIRRPLTLRMRIAIQQVGMAFLLLLMITIIFQDILRLFN